MNPVGTGTVTPRQFPKCHLNRAQSGTIRSLLSSHSLVPFFLRTLSTQVNWPMWCPFSGSEVVNQLISLLSLTQSWPIVVFFADSLFCLLYQVVYFEDKWAIVTMSGLYVVIDWSIFCPRNSRILRLFVLHGMKVSIKIGF